MLTKANELLRWAVGGYLERFFESQYYHLVSLAEILCSCISRPLAGHDVDVLPFRATLMSSNVEYLCEQKLSIVYVHVDSQRAIAAPSGASWDKEPCCT